MNEPNWKIIQKQSDGPIFSVLTGKGSGFVVSGSGNANYNGTYCYDAQATTNYNTSEYNGSVYKNQNNIYIYYGGNWWWMGPVVGNTYGSSDGYYIAGGPSDESVFSGSWSSYSCCGTSLGGPISVSATSC